MLYKSKCASEARKFDEFCKCMLGYPWRLIRSLSTLILIIKFPINCKYCTCMYIVYSLFLLFYYICISESLAPCPEGYCNVRGICMTQGDEYICECSKVYSGDRCQEGIRIYTIYAIN